VSGTARNASKAMHVSFVLKILGFYYIFESENADAKTREYFIFV
jgi:hypothetical protein